MTNRRTSSRLDTRITEPPTLGLSWRGLSTAEAYRQEAQLDAALHAQGRGCSPMIKEILLAHLLNAVLLPKFEHGEVATASDAMLIKALIDQIGDETKAKWTPEPDYDESNPEYFEDMSFFEQDPLSDDILLKRALDPNEYAYYDYYKEPPYVFDSGTSGGSLRLGITERMVRKRFFRLRGLIRRYGVVQRWSDERITQATKKGAYPMVDPDDPQISRYRLR